MISHHAKARFPFLVILLQGGKVVALLIRRGTDTLYVPLQVGAG